MSNIFIISHGPCADGTMAAAIIYAGLLKDFAVRNVSPSPTPSVTSKTIKFVDERVFPDRELKITLLSVGWTEQLTEFLQAEKFKGALVYMLDISLAENVMTELLNQAENVVLIDHHPKALDYTADSWKLKHPNLIAYVKTEIPNSGASLAWEYTYNCASETVKEKLNSATMPETVKAIAARDTWTHKQNKDLDAIASALFARNAVSSVDSAMKYLNPTPQEIEELKIEGRTIMQLNDKMTTTIAQNSAVFSTWIGKLAPNSTIKSIARNLGSVGENDTFKFAIVNSPVMQSEVGNYLVSENPEIGLCLVVRYDFKLDKWYASVRSMFGKDNVDKYPNAMDCNQFCKLFGGGGHTAASGFELTGYTKLVSSLLELSFPQEN